MPARPIVRATVREGTSEAAALDVEFAMSFWRRTVGLLGRRGLPSATGLLIRPCGSVHTFGMRFTIDAVYLDRDGRIVKVAPRLRPWRLSRGGRGAHATLELAAGEAERLGMTPGAQVAW